MFWSQSLLPCEVRLYRLGKPAHGLTVVVCAICVFPSKIWHTCLFKQLSICSASVILANSPTLNPANQTPLPRGIMP